MASGEGGKKARGGGKALRGIGMEEATRSGGGTEEAGGGGSEEAGGWGGLEEAGGGGGMEKTGGSRGRVEEEARGRGEDCYHSKGCRQCSLASVEKEQIKQLETMREELWGKTRGESGGEARGKAREVSRMWRCDYCTKKNTACHWPSMSSKAGLCS